MPRSHSYRNAMLLMTASSMSVPLIGLVSAPVLARGLGVDGRGEVAAALAPNLLILGVASIGLTDALTYHVARRPWAGGRALLLGSGVVTAAGMLATLIVIAFAGLLSGGRPELARLMIVGSVIAVPTLVVNLFRATAAGRQRWTAMAVERVLTSVLRLVALLILLSSGGLSVLSALIVSAVAPIVGIVVYVRLFATPVARPEDDTTIAARDLLSFGSRTWLGSIALMVMARLSQLLVTPLSDVRQLGLLIVAVTISDVPYMFANTIRDVVFGVESAERDVARLITTSRIATLLAFVGSLVLGVTLPLWIQPVFGAAFGAAMLPTWILLLSCVATVAGLVAGAGLASGGRPGLRSVSLVIALGGNLLGLLALVPPLGADGAALADLLGSTASTVFALVAASRVLGRPVSAFVVPRREDVARLAATGVAVLRSRRASVD